jgi:polyketide synthase 13
VTEPEPWPRYSGTATAGVSAFGFGGTNAHILLQEYRPTPAKSQATLISRACVSGPVTVTTPTSTALSIAPAVLALDAPTAERLREDAADLAAWLCSDAGGRARLADVALTLSGRLGKGRHRAAVVARTREQAGEALADLAAGKPHPATVTGFVRPAAADAVWVFSGYGSQWPGMARRLLAEEPVFAEALDRLEALIRRHAAGLSLRACLEPDADLTRPSVVQPVLFGLQVALAAMWRAHGLTPAAVIGHSMGEVAAAVVAGAIDEDAGARIIAVRSRLLNGLTGGAMAVVDRTPEEVEQLAQRLHSLRIAVHASPRQCVVAGTADDVSELIREVGGEGGLARALPVAVAGHTPQVDPILKPFAARLGAVPYREPACLLYTTVDEDPRRTPDLDTAYWVRNLREPVRFRQAVTAAAEDGHRTFVEVSPHPTQLHPLAETLRAAGIDDALVLPTLRRDTDELVTFRQSLAALLLRGAVDPLTARRSLHPEASVTDMPTARWRHQRYWATSPVVGFPDASGFASRSGFADASGFADVGRIATTEQMSTADRLRACIAHVTGYTADSIDDEIALTALGLDSLQAVRILALVKQEFGVELPRQTLLRGAALATVAALLDGTDEQPAAQPQAAAARGVLPRDATERLIARLWQSVSGEPVTDVNTHLPSFAQRPAAITTLANALSEEAGQPVAIGDLFGADAGPATIASLASRLRPLLDTPAIGPLRVLRRHGSRPPLFLIHPAGGSSAVYRSLARRLDDEQPCFGLERLADLQEVGERAAEYARVIRATRPSGPWAIGGWSYGGLVAQEAAQLLQAEGGEVTALVLIDSVLPLPAPGFSPQEEARSRFAAFADYVRDTYGSTLTLPYAELAQLDDAGQIELIIKALQQTADLPPAVLDHQRDSYLDLRSGERHTPGPYLGRTVLYRASEPAPHTVADARYERDDDALGWDEFCPDLTVTHVPGDHLSLLDPPTVDVLARLLDLDLVHPPR